MGKNDNDIKENIGVRFNIKSDKDPALYKKLKEMQDFLSPIKSAEVIKFIIEKAYDFWYSKEIKSKIKKS